MSRTVVASIGFVLAASLPVGAVQVPPSVSDIATCNQEAAAKTGHPSALPAPRPRVPDSAQAVPHAREGVLVGRHTEPATPPQRGPALDPPAGGSVGQKTDPSGSIITQSPDPLLEGMDAERAGDAAYRAAYRECMEQRRPR